MTECGNKNCQIIKTFDGNTPAKISIPINDGNHGIEHLLNVLVYKIKEANSEVLYQDQEMFRGFLKLLKRTNK